jgi:hypothetical protein
MSKCRRFSISWTKRCRQIKPMSYLLRIPIIKHPHRHLSHHKILHLHHTLPRLRHHLLVMRWRWRPLPL